jgi:CheY-like chemotaxis protein
VLEDEALIRMMLVEMIEELGHSVVAEAGDVNMACILANAESFNLAILDINLQDRDAGPIAEILSRRGLPFFFLRGYGASGAPDKFASVPVLKKPYTSDALGLAIELALINK